MLLARQLQARLPLQLIPPRLISVVVASNCVAPFEGGIVSALASITRDEEARKLAMYRSAALIHIFELMARRA